MSHCPSKLMKPQREEEEDEDVHALLLSDIRSLSFSCIQRFEDGSKAQAKQRLPFSDMKPDEDFEFCSPVSTPTTNRDILFCGRIINQRESTERQCSKIGLPASAMSMKVPYQKATQVSSSASSKRRNQYGVLAFHPEMELKEMKKRQASLDQKETDQELGCHHHEKKKLGLIRRMKSRGNIISVLACYPLAAPVMNPNY